jgi:hypothetical protein
VPCGWTDTTPDCSCCREEKENKMACTVENNRLYCTTSDTAFGPRFQSEEEADEFLAWEFKHYGDPRQFSSDELEDHVREFRND